MERADGRKTNELRPVEMTADFTKFAEGSVLIRCGDTVVLCNASVEERVPPHVRPGHGWVTAEYSMLPRANRERSRRDVDKLKLSGRSAEIQRLIGRSLRAAVDMSLLGERTITIDCDVLQGDGGTRTASVTGGSLTEAVTAVETLPAATEPDLRWRWRAAVWWSAATSAVCPSGTMWRASPPASWRKRPCWICNIRRIAGRRWI